MSTIDHPKIKALIQNAAKASQLMAPSPERDLIAHLTHALAEVHEVAVGADHTAAKYWTRLTAAERALEAERANVKRAQAEAIREFRQRLINRQTKQYGIVLPDVHEIVDDLDHVAICIESEAPDA